MFKKLKEKVVKIVIERVINKLAKENKMIGGLMKWLDGKKTYLLACLWMVYKVGVSSGWWPENPTIEALLIGGGAAALREAVEKVKK